MTSMSEIAIRECVAELRAACRRPVEESALETVIGWLRPQFERILDRLDGGKRWADYGQRLRENSRHLGALADFFANHADAATVGIDELTQAMKMARADCTVRAERTPVAYEFCHLAPFDATLAEEFLRAFAPTQEPVRRAG